MPKSNRADHSAELGSVYFSIRERNFDALARAKANRDFSKKTELEAEMARQREQYVSCCVPHREDADSVESKGRKLIASLKPLYPEHPKLEA